MAQVAASALAVPHSRIREIADMAMAMGDSVLRLYFGESNLPTPGFIKRAAQKAMQDGFTFYTENAGLPSTRRMIGTYYQLKHGVELDPLRQIVVTASGVQALQLGMRCVLDPGDEAIVLTPAWQNQMSIARMCVSDVKMVPFELKNARFCIDFDALERVLTPKTRLLVYTSPSNPLGWVATVEDQRQLLDFTRKHNLWLLADEVYERLWYPADGSLGKPVPSILKLCGKDDAVLVIQSFSKSYCMTGWRVGWLAGRPDLIERATKLNEFVVSCAPAFSQRAAEAALEWGDDTVRQMLTLYKSNRDYCLQALRKVKRVHVPESDGAFYLFPRIEGLEDSFKFCKTLLLDTGVGLAPGVAFGAGGEGSIRICYAVEREILEEAMGRLIAFLKT